MAPCLLAPRASLWPEAGPRSWCSSLSISAGLQGKTQRATGREEEGNSSTLRRRGDPTRLPPAQREALWTPSSGHGSRPQGLGRAWLPPRRKQTGPEKEEGAAGEGAGEGTNAPRKRESSATQPLPTPDCGSTNGPTERANTKGPKHSPPPLETARPSVRAPNPAASYLNAQSGSRASLLAAFSPFLLLNSFWNSVGAMLATARLRTVLRALARPPAPTASPPPP